MLPDKYYFIAVLEYGEGGTIGVHFPDLPGCISAADTTEKAIENAKEACRCTFAELKRTVRVLCGYSIIGVYVTLHCYNRNGMWRDALLVYIAVLLCNGMALM